MWEIERDQLIGTKYLSTGIRFLFRVCFHIAFQMLGVGVITCALPARHTATRLRRPIGQGN